jgi:hypothetical protein
MVFSTNEKSPNLIYALQAAREKQSMTVTFAGKDGGRFPEAADYCFIVPSYSIYRIQEVHATAVHIAWTLCISPWERKKIGEVNHLREGELPDSTCRGSSARTAHCAPSKKFDQRLSTDLILKRVFCCVARDYPGARHFHPNEVRTNESTESPTRDDSVDDSGRQR